MPLPTYQPTKSVARAPQPLTRTNSVKCLGVIRVNGDGTLLSPPTSLRFLSLLSLLPSSFLRRHHINPGLDLPAQRNQTIVVSHFLGRGTSGEWLCLSCRRWLRTWGGRRAARRRTPIRVPGPRRRTSGS
jgi:hypothetical protein